MWLNKRLLTLVCLFLIAKIQFTNCIWWAPIDLPGEKRIDGVRFLGEGTVNHLSDKDSNTAHAPPPSPYPYFWVDLKGLYNITTIQMLSQNNWYNGMNGINTEFQISTWDQFIHPCKKQTFTGWKACQTNAKFTKKGEVINFKCAPEAAVAQYVMFSRGSPTNNETILGPYAAEIWFYGEKINDGGITPEPEDNPEVENVHLKTREELLTGVETITVDPAWAKFTLDNTFDDVALGCHDNRVNIIAARRGKGRIVAVLGTHWLSSIDQQNSLTTFKTNLAKWLANTTLETASFVKINEEYKPGDILIVTREHQLDVPKIKQLILDGKNSLLVGYLGNKQNPNDDLTDLLKELGIQVIQDKAHYGRRDIWTKDMLGKQKCIPQTYRIKLYTQSWKQFRTEHVYQDMTVLENSYMPEMKSPEFQKRLRALLDKYYSYFKDRHPCEGNKYHWEDRTRNAWYNYNMYAMAQKTENILTLPGVEYFPGLVKDTETPVTHRVTINAPKSGFYYPIGVYANAGQVFKWKVISHSHNLNNYYLTVSCHKDNINGNKPWARWPRHMHRHQLSPEDSYASPIGGVLFMGMWNDNQNITLELENVYRHPWFDLRNKTSVDDWDNERKRYNGVPWMAFMGDAMHVCLPVNEVVKINKIDMTYTATYYDNVVKLMHNFRGSRVENDGFQVFATDVQLSAGWGHSGIPIMGYLPWVEAFTKVRAGYNDLRNGMTHEIGHNLQNGACTFKYGGEVTNNVYHFPVFQHLLNISGYRYNEYLAFADWEMKQVIDVWKGKTYEGVNLGYYNWLGILFGEGLLVNLFGKAWGNRNNLGSEAAKTNFWLSAMCEETGYNVIPWQELWHFPINNETRSKCDQYPCFFPDDVVTQRAPEIVQRQIDKQPNGCVRKVEKKVQPNRDILHNLNTIRPQFTFFH